MNLNFILGALFLCLCPNVVLGSVIVENVPSQMIYVSEETIKYAYNVSGDDRDCFLDSRSIYSTVVNNTYCIEVDMQHEFNVSYRELEEKCLPEKHAVEQPKDIINEFGYPLITIVPRAVYQDWVDKSRNIASVSQLLKNVTQVDNIYSKINVSTAEFCDSQINYTTPSADLETTVDSYIRAATGELVHPLSSDTPMKWWPELNLCAPTYNEVYFVFGAIVVSLSTLRIWMELEFWKKGILSDMILDLYDVCCSFGLLLVCIINSTYQFVCDLMRASSEYVRAIYTRYNQDSTDTDTDKDNFFVPFGDS